MKKKKLINIIFLIIISCGKNNLIINSKMLKNSSNEFKYDILYQEKKSLNEKFRSTIIQENLICSGETLEAKELNRVTSLLKNNFLDEIKKERYTDTGLENFIILEASNNNIKTKRDLLDNKLVPFLKKMSSTYMLLLGSSGSGKSTYGKYLILKLWQKYKGQDDIIPLFISLPKIYRQQQIEKALIDNFLRLNGLNKTEICAIKDLNLLVFFDAFDELHRLLNLYIMEKIGYIKNTKIIVGMRTEYIDGPEANFVFMTNKGESAERLYIHPFTEKQMGDYIKNELKNEGITSEKVIKKEIEKIAKISKKLKMNTDEYSPLKLKIFIEMKGLVSDNLYKNLKLFTDIWFLKEATRVMKFEETYKVDEYKKRRKEMQAKFGIFSKKLAFRMFKYDIYKYTKYRTSVELNNLFAEFYEDENSLNREGSPIRYFARSEYGFIEKSIQDFFVADLLLDEIKSYSNNSQNENLYINQKILYNKDVIEILEEGLKEKENKNKYISNLKYIIEASRKEGIIRSIKNFQNNEMAIASINAVTILNNHDKKIFKGKDTLKACYLSIEDNIRDTWKGPILEGADLRRSDLTNSMFNGANFRGSDLRYADLSYASLDNADFTNANLSNANLFWSSRKDAKIKYKKDPSNINLHTEPALFGGIVLSIIIIIGILIYNKCTKNKFY